MIRLKNVHGLQQDFDRFLLPGIRNSLRQVLTNFLAVWEHSSCKINEPRGISERKNVLWKLTASYLHFVRVRIGSAAPSPSRFLVIVTDE